MTWVSTSDPLALLAIESGQKVNPSIQEGASGSSRLDVNQRSIDIGEPVPIVFARRRNNAGGILISPGATEARFENDANNNVTAYYHLVLSEGRIDSIPVKDVLQRSCRVGSHTQTYNRRAGTWLPGNYIIERPGFDKPEASYICGSIGIYPNMSTLSFSVTIPDGFDYWNRQVHLFIRGGMYVTRLLDSVFGPSDNFADLVRWMLANNGRVPTALIDTTALTKAAQFLEANGFTCNCWLQEARNYSDLLAEWAPYFLLGESNINGKKGLRPLLPTNNDGTIKTTTITPEYTFTEEEILPGSLEINYTGWTERQPFVAQMIWRQELESEAAVIRTVEVRFENTAELGPYESHDLSAFCTSEVHAVKAGAYILAKRIHSSHTARFSVRPQVYGTTITTGSVIGVSLERNTSGGAPSRHDYLYQVERITTTLAGEISYECTHFPVDKNGCSIISQLVNQATGAGILLATNTTGVGCDINSSTDETIPAEEFIEPGDQNDPSPDPDGIGTSAALDIPATDLDPLLGTGPDDEPLYGGYGAKKKSDNLDTSNSAVGISGLLPNKFAHVYTTVTALTPCNPQWRIDGQPQQGETSTTYQITPRKLGNEVTVTDDCGGISDGAVIVGYDPKFSLNGGVKANVTFRRIIDTQWKTNCSTNAVTTYNEDVSTVYNLNFVEIKTRTRDIGGGYVLPNTMNYEISCNTGAGQNYRINGAAQLLTAGGQTINVDLWGNNIVLDANQGLSSFHSTIITSIVLTEANPAYGVVGDNVLGLGILEAVSSGASFWTRGVVIT